MKMAKLGLALVVMAFMLLAGVAFAADAPKSKAAVFAGGCFWCMESDFEHEKGKISDVVSGYTGGKTANPTYYDVSGGDTGHLEAVQVTYDPAQITYAQLLDIFWQNVDPFDASGQFCDKGSQYRAAIFYANDEEKGLAEASLKKVEEKYGKKVETLILPAATFYVAEEKHQDYASKQTLHYKLYRNGCGRDAVLKGLREQGK
jgi:methionine-S-sulfoxide reductase